MICDHQNKKEIHKFGAISLYKCGICGLIFTDKHGKDVDSKTLYADYYNNETKGVGRFGFGIEYVIRMFRFFRAFKIFTVCPYARKILDVGSGRGFTLYYLKKYYKYTRTAGTQISRSVFEFSRDILGLEIYDKDLLELSLSDKSFDVITIWHVLEHVAHHEEYIKKLFNLLDDHGKLLIEVPNYNSWTRALTKEYWLGLDLDYHVTFFTPESISCLLKKYNFNAKIIHTFSLEYSTFISAQSIISLLTKSKHLFFQSLQTTGFSCSLVFHIFLFMLLSPICFFINLLLYFTKRGEVLFVVAEKV